MKTRLAPFIAIEGMDGSGKSTLVDKLREKFPRSTGDRVLFTREPGGPPLAEALRNLFLSEQFEGAEPKTKILTLFAGRNEHLAKLINLRRRDGTAVITDRFDASTHAYQVITEARDSEEQEELDDLFWTLRNKIVYGENAPTLYLYLDLPPKTAYARRNADLSQTKNHYDTALLASYERRHAGYDDFLSEIERQGGSEVVRIDASQPRDEVFEDAFQAILEHIRSY